MRAGFFAALDQQPVQIRIGAENGHLPRSSEIHHLVYISSEVDVAAHERVHLGTTAFASMNEADTARQQVTIGKLPADTDRPRKPSLNLMPIRKPVDSDVMYGHRELFSLVHAQANAFIDDRAVALGSTKGVTQQVGRIQHVIKQPGLPKVRIAS